MSSSISQNPIFSCDGMLLRMIEIWMKPHLVSDNKCNPVNLYSPHPKSIQGMTNNVELTLSVGDTIPGFTVSIEQDN